MLLKILLACNLILDVLLGIHLVRRGRKRLMWMRQYGVEYEFWNEKNLLYQMKIGFYDLLDWVDSVFRMRKEARRISRKKNALLPLLSPFVFLGSLIGFGYSLPILQSGELILGLALYLVSALALAFSVLIHFTQSDKMPADLPAEVVSRVAVGLEHKAKKVATSSEPVKKKTGGTRKTEGTTVSSDLKVLKDKN